MLINTCFFKEELKSLWHNVFGDSEEYISLFFDYSYSPKECFAFFDNNKIVSALYLLESELSVNGKDFKGRYLYAAATEKSHRGKGIMSLLIKEAQDFCEKENLDFISLVPADDYLYTYYSKFGFCENMFRFVSAIKSEREILNENFREISFDKYFQKRREFLKAGFHFSFAETQYASLCLEKGGYIALGNTFDSFFLFDREDSAVLEYISSEENFKENTIYFLSHLKNDITVFSPYELWGQWETKKERYGMVYPINSLLKENGEFYMNIALD